MTLSLNTLSTNQVDRRPKNTGKPYTKADIEQLRQFAREGLSIVQMAQKMDRSPYGVNLALVRNNISLRYMRELENPAVKVGKGQLVEWIRQGKTTGEIADRLGITKRKLEGVYKREKISVRRIHHDMKLAAELAAYKDL